MSLPDWIDPALDAEEMRSADEWAIEGQGRDSLELMETAGRAVADAVGEMAPEGPISVVCGKGNNGGDGLVVARLLAEAGFRAEALLLWPAGELSNDAASNLERLGDGWRQPDPEEVEGALSGAALIVDAIFGTGFSGAPRAPADAAIEAINDAGVPVVACDVASGVDASTGEAEGVVVEADRTVSFHARKLGQLIQPGKGHTGELVVAAIGIPDGAPVEPGAGSISTRVLARAPGRGASSNKFSSGNVVAVGGSRGMTGAIAMTAQAAIRAGAGYAAAIVPASIEPTLEVKLTEVMTVGVADDGEGRISPDALGTILERCEGASFVVVGPGLGRSDGASELIADICARVEAPLLVDADGLNALGTDLSVLRGRTEPTVLTPHGGELARLLGVEGDAVRAARLEKARGLAREAEAICVLKGDDTIVTDGERVGVNVLAAPALATAGTGDVLSGM
ncbi:MAG: NAD(P)H-hydrate epimerase, partial [Solirubrobacterales bacterium]